MKIVNICLAGSYNNGWGYQDNLITKYQVLNGNESTIITTRFINDKKTEGYLEVPSGIEYDNGVKVIRLEHGIGRKLTKLFRVYKNLYKILEEERPEFIFIHCCQFMDITKVCKYLKKHPQVYCCVDNHADYTNSAKSIFARFIHKTLWKRSANKINRYASVFFGVIPLRCDFLHDMYNIPEDKIRLLVMGADDEKVCKAKQNRNTTRSKYNISDSDFLIVTGGKIDSYKKNTIDLLKAVNKLKNRGVKLIVFGSVTDELKKDFQNNLGDSIYLNWINQDEIYNILCASDLVIYPGRHSVLWEQTVGCGIPAIFNDIANTHHIDIGGNCIIESDMSENSLYDMINRILSSEEIINSMKTISQSRGIDYFSYKNIAKQSIDITIEIAKHSRINQN